MADKKLLLFAAMLLAACTTDPIEQQPGMTIPENIAHKIVNSNEGAAQGSLLVYFDQQAVGKVESTVAEAATTRSAVTRSGLANVDEVLSALGVHSMQRVFPYNARNEERARAAGMHRWYIVGFDADADLIAAAGKLAVISEVNCVQFNSRLEKAGNDLRPRPLRAGAMEAAAVSNSFNDPELARQWHYINIGNKSIAQTIRAGADINVQDAWKLTGGNPSVIVAVIDEGVKYSHPDLAANMWVNTAEQSGTTGKDDDNNGYKDDIHGYNFAEPGEISWNKPHFVGNENKGDVGHGTHVAGTVAAVNNNGQGVCGVAGGTGRKDGVKIMSCQIFSGNSPDSGTAATSSAAIYYAANNGASILQCSFGSAGGSITSDDAFAARAGVQKTAIDYFMATKNCNAIDGGVVIFAAGNESTPVASYPGAYRDYISVTSFSPDFLPAYYTNYGPGSNIAAPGGDYKIASDGESSTVLSTVPSELFDGANYGFMQGTSMACPHVSGIAALGLSYALQKGKHFTLSEFKSMLLTSVNDIDRYLEGVKGSMNLGLYHKKMGTGAIDAYQLLMQIEDTPCLKAKVGTKQLIALTKYFGGAASNLTYVSVTMTPENQVKLGITEAPSISYGKLSIHCTKPGVARITITAIAGGESVGGGASMGGQTVTKEFAIIARAAGNANGGWL